MEVVPIKDLGQNFLKKSPKTLLPPIEEIKNSDTVFLVEIGSGTGRLTYDALLQITRATQNVYFLGIEIDKRMKPYLDAILREFKDHKISFLFDDVLRTDLLKVTKEKFSDLLKKDFLLFIFGSLPYNISKPIISWSIAQSAKLLSYKKGIRFLPFRFLLQKEVAQNYASLPPNADFLSVYLSLFTEGEIKILQVLPRTAFEPVPKVEGAVLEFRLDIKKLKEYKERARLAKIIRRFFRYKRKTLKKILKKDETLKNLNIKLEGYENRRPPELSVTEWLGLLLGVNSSS